MGVCRAVRDADAKFADDAQWVPQTRAYQRLQAEHARATGELAQAHTDRAALEAALRREQEALRVRHTEFSQLHRAAAMQEVRRARPMHARATLARERLSLTNCGYPCVS